MTTATTRTTADGGHADLIAVIDRQGGLLGQLDALSQRQRALAEADDIEPLLALLAQRQEIVDQLARGSETVERLRVSRERAGGTPPQGERAEVQRRLNALAELAAAVSRRDEADQEVLRGRRERVASELAELTASKRAVSAYGGGGAAPTARFQDREG